MATCALLELPQTAAVSAESGCFVTPYLGAVWVLLMLRYVCCCVVLGMQTMSSGASFLPNVARKSLAEQLALLRELQSHQASEQVGICSVGICLPCLVGLHHPGACIL